MFMPHIVSQRINFSGHSPLRVFYVCETALNFGAKREALQTTGWDFGDELLKCNSVGNDWIYDTAIRGYRHFHFKTKIQRFQLFKSFIMVIFKLLYKIFFSTENWFKAIKCNLVSDFRITTTCFVGASIFF